MSLLLPKPYSSVSASNSVVDAAGEKHAYVFAAPRTGNIDRVGFRILTTTGGNLDCRIETVDGSTGAPSGTLVNAGANGIRAILSTDDNVWLEQALTSMAATVAGSPIAYVLAHTGADSLNVTFAGLTNQLSTGFPYMIDNTGSWSSIARDFIGAVRYNDGAGNTEWVYVPGLLPISAFSTVNLTSTSNPRQAGNIITAPFAMRVIGIWASTNAFAGDFSIKCYRTTDLSTPAASASVDGTNQANKAYGEWILDSYIDLASSEDINVVLEATTATGRGVQVYDVNSADLRRALSGGSRTQYISRAGTSGAFTVLDTRYAQVGLIIDPAYSGGGGSSGASSIFGGAVIR